MENVIKIVKECNNPKILVITPLLPGHKISKETKKTIKRNDVKFKWIASIGKNNIPTNVELGMNWYWRTYKTLPPFVFPLDNDIILGRKILDKLLNKLEFSDEDIAFSYASFEFKGTVNKAFPADPYDIKRLMEGNYISSNSLFKSYVVFNVGFVTDDMYKRLLDYAMILKLFGAGYKGIPCPEANFIAISTKNDISAGSETDYWIKYNRVKRDFIQPLYRKGP